MVEHIAEVIAGIRKSGTAIILVEQNAAMALALSDTAYVLEVGRVSLHGPAAQLAATDEVRQRYLGVQSGPRAAPAKKDAPIALAVQGLSVRFGGVAALSEVTFSVAHGSVHALIGPNGAGKSTCLNVLTGVYRATSGSARYQDEELTRLAPHRIARLGVGRTFQNLALSASETVRQNLLLGRHRLTRAGFLSAGLGLRVARREHAEQERHAANVAEMLELGNVLDSAVSTLAYGLRKRVELARALCAQPALLLLDEPVAGMTAADSTALAQMLARIRTDLGVTILIVEHDMAFVMGIADEVTVLDFGRRIAGGAPSEIQRNPEVIRAYLGTAQGVTS